MSYQCGVRVALLRREMALFELDSRRGNLVIFMYIFFDLPLSENKLAEPVFFVVDSVRHLDVTVMRPVGPS